MTQKKEVFSLDNEIKKVKKINLKDIPIPSPYELYGIKRKRRKR